jgi:protein involved in polysaccharide export with SLBB domain
MTAPVSAQTQVASPVSDQAYQIGPGDRVRISVFGETELTGDYDVAADGSLMFPLVGAFRAAEMTPPELSSAIAERLRAGYLRDPQVSSSVIVYRPFYILGEVTNPGTYPFAPNLDVLSAVAVAGGYTYRANRGRVFIRRAGEASERRYSLRDRVSVGPGDTIRIGERFF